MYVRLFFIFGWIFVFANSSAAEELAECMKNAKGETPSVAQCYQDQIELSEKEIMDIFSDEYEEGVESKVVIALKKGQPQWLEYIDGVCSAYLELGGQRGDVLQKNCLSTKYKERAKEIRQLLEQASF